MFIMTKSLDFYVNAYSSRLANLYIKVGMWKYVKTRNA